MIRPYKTYRHRSPSYPNRRPGAVVVLLLFCIVAIVAFGVVVLNLCWLNDCREEIQSCADSTAIAAAESLLLNGDADSSMRLARQNASHFVINRVGQSLSDSDFEFGRNRANADGTYSFLADHRPFNTVRVTARRDASQTSAVPLFLGNILGFDSLNIHQSASATFADHDVAMVIDAAGMMHGPGRFSGVRELAEEFFFLARRTPVNLRISVTLFSKDAETVLPLTDDFSRVEEILDQIKLRGPRNLGAGMHVGLVSLFDPDHSRQSAKKSLLILSECKSPNGIDPISVAAIARQNEVDVDVFTFTKIAGRRLAAEIAREANGQHHHALNRAGLQQALQHFVVDVPVFLFQ